MSAPLYMPRSSQALSDLEALLARMRRRLYPETIPVLVSYWLKSVYARGHKRSWWKELNGLLTETLRDPQWSGTARESLSEVRTWIQQGGVLSGKTAPGRPSRVEPYRTNVRPERLGPYIGRLLNRWLSAEVAGMLVEENDLAPEPAGGIPVLAIGKAIERLLVRERLSPGTLEMLLDPALLSPRYIYPADAEMLRDVVLALLGRTEAPEPPVMPAVVLGVAAGAPLPPDYEDAVRQAAYVETQGREEVHVPITAAQGLEILKSGPVRIASILVTMDGRWWEPENLQSGEPYRVVYRPGGRLRIDYSADHARLDVPCVESRLEWCGEVSLDGPIEMFGREWRASSWETDGERAWLHMVFARAIAMAEIQPAAEAAPQRPRSAAVDMAWAALENALATAIREDDREPIEQLRRADFVPLGRALFEFAEALRSRRLPNRETLETQLRAIRYLEAEVCLEYGRVPWRILPSAARGAFLKRRLDGALVELLNQVFDGLPDGLRQPAGQSPSQAA